MIIKIPIIYLFLLVLFLIYILLFYIAIYKYDKIFSFYNLIFSIRNDKWILKNNYLINKSLYFQVQKEKLFLYNCFTNSFDSLNEKFTNIELDIILKEFKNLLIKQ